MEYFVQVCFWVFLGGLFIRSGGKLFIPIIMHGRKVNALPFLHFIILGSFSSFLFPSFMMRMQWKDFLVHESASGVGEKEESLL